MKSLIKAVKHSVQSVAREEEGAQVVEYALIIAVVSIALVIVLRGLNGSTFADFIARVDSCLSTAVCV